MTVIGKGSVDIDKVTKELVAGSGDKKTVKLQSYRGPTVSICPRQSSHAHMILRPYIAGQNDREKNDTIDNSFLKVIKSAVDKDILNQALEDEDKVSDAINFTLFSTYEKLRALPPKCKDVVDFKTLFSSNNKDETLRDKVTSLMHDKRVEGCNTAEKYLEQTGLAHYFKIDSGDDNVTPEDLLNTPLVTIKQRRENALQMQAAHITSHILDAKGLKTDMSIEQKEDGSLSIGLKKQGSDASETSVVSYSDYSEEQNKNLVTEAQNRFKKFKSENPPSGLSAYLNPQALINSAVEQVTGEVEHQKAGLGELFDSKIDKAQELVDSTKELADSTIDRSQGLVGSFTSKAGAAVMGLAGATALVGAPFLAPSFGIAAAGAVGLMGAAALGMSIYSFFKPKKDEAKADNTNKDKPVSKDNDKDNPTNGDMSSGSANDTSGASRAGDADDAGGASRAGVDNASGASRAGSGQPKGEEGGIQSENGELDVTVSEATPVGVNTESAEKGRQEAAAKAAAKAAAATGNSGGGWLGRTAKAAVSVAATPFAVLFGGGANPHPVARPSESEHLDTSIHGNGDGDESRGRDGKDIASSSRAEGVPENSSHSNGSGGVPPSTSEASGVNDSDLESVSDGKSNESKNIHTVERQSTTAEKDDDLVEISIEESNTPRNEPKGWGGVITRIQAAATAYVSPWFAPSGWGGGTDSSRVEDDADNTDAGRSISSSASRSENPPQKKPTISQQDSRQLSGTSSDVGDAFNAMHDAAVDASF